MQEVFLMISEMNDLATVISYKNKTTPSLPATAGKLHKRMK
jgi:hypothetical protein